MDALTHSRTRHDFEDARHLIERLEEQFGGRIRDKLTTARELVQEAENIVADEGCEL